MVERRPRETSMSSCILLLVLARSKRKIPSKSFAVGRGLSGIFAQDVPARVSGFSAGVQYIASSSPGTRILLKPSRKFSRPVNGWENATGHEARGSWCTTVVNLGNQDCLHISVGVVILTGDPSCAAFQHRDNCIFKRRQD
jgi:hypothetical protein